MASVDTPCRETRERSSRHIPLDLWVVEVEDGCGVTPSYRVVETAHDLNVCQRHSLQVSLVGAAKETQLQTGPSRRSRSATRSPKLITAIAAGSTSIVFEGRRSITPMPQSVASTSTLRSGRVARRWRSPSTPRRTKVPRRRRLGPGSPTRRSAGRSRGPGPRRRRQGRSRACLDVAQRLSEAVVAVDEDDVEATPRRAAPRSTHRWSRGRSRPRSSVFGCASHFQRGIRGRGSTATLRMARDVQEDDPSVDPDLQIAGRVGAARSARRRSPRAADERRPSSLSKHAHGEVVLPSRDASGRDHAPRGARGAQGRGAARPPVGPGEVRIAVRAAGINFADLMARSGVYPDAPPPPCVIGYEVAGEVESVGEGVDGARGRRPGDRRDPVRRLRGAGLGARPSQVVAASRGAQLRAGSRVRRQLHDRLGGAGDHGRSAGGRAGADPRRGRRGRDRRDPGREADRRRDLRHRVGRPSTTRSAPRASITRSTTATATSPRRRCGSPAGSAST